ncbi:MAG: hypothetical protein DI555_21755 [Novosphingobium pentaromativorans]|uniref:RES domain-containing protein n=1 Tax=Novosphingobium pentaromativorans TaxID=205844 RepID=A0A2W5Q157_9SPHN|nr:hypothetical protein [Novosphingobium panipatense]PZQ50977.1 MAG: hypothetical protein DI555_21755 [Novosphingobium pentaromativorans]
MPRPIEHSGDLKPTAIVAYDSDGENVLNSRAPGALNKFGMTPSGLADPGWRDQMRGGKEATLAFSQHLITKGVNRLLVRSFARGAAEVDLNLVLWKWGATSPPRVSLIDDEGRLSGI